MVPQAKETALSMAADGMKAEKIAHYLKVRVAMVQNWIDESMSPFLRGNLQPERSALSPYGYVRKRKIIQVIQECNDPDGFTADLMGT